MATKDEFAIDFNLADEQRMLMLKTVLQYEAGIRGLTLGQVVVQMVDEAVDIDSYPKGVRDRLREIEAASIASATERARLAVELPKSA